MLYEVLKALHIISVIAWMAGLLYLPRLFVYHADAAKGSAQSETFKTMERRLLRGIMNPAMILTWVFGLALTWQGEWWHAGWCTRSSRWCAASPSGSTCTDAGARNSRKIETFVRRTIIAGGTKCRPC